MMNYKIQKFQSFLKTNFIETINKRLSKIVRGYLFHYISQEANYDENHFVCQNIKNTKLLIIDHYQSDPYFIIGFRNTIILIKQTLLRMIHSFFTNDLEIIFLNNSEKIFHQYIDTPYKKSINNDYFQEEIQNFNKQLDLDRKKLNQITEINEIWLLIRSCISGYLIKIGYSKLFNDRITKFYTSNQQQSPKIIDEDEYIELRLLGIGTLFDIKLIYLIECEKLIAIKKTHMQDEENEKLAKREIRNYSIIKHPFIPKYYGTTKKNKYIVFEFIYGQTLSNIKKFHFSEVDKITIIFQLLSVFKYLHDNHFIYRDLKPNNIMIDQNKTAVLIDFDRMISEEENEDKEVTTMNFVPNYSAPEINLLQFSKKNDIYSIGKLIYFIIKEKNPSSSADTKNDLNENSLIFQIYSKCITENANDRPSVAEIIDILCCYIIDKNFVLEHINPKEQNKIGLMFEKSNKINEAIKYYHFAADQNDSEAFLNLAFVYYTGESITRDTKQAIHYFTLAADHNNSDAQFILGIIYSTGEIVPRDINKAIHYYLLAAGSNNPRALFNLGVLYDRGESVPRDIKKAIQYYFSAVLQNHAGAQFNLAIIYDKGIYVPRDVEKAIMFYTLAADNNHSDAQFNLGFIYENDNSIPHDINKAIHYYSLAADQNNHSGAQFNLGIIYDKGELIQRDIKKAIHYYSLAAKQNNPKAQYNLGIIHLIGNYVTRNINKAIYYLSLAAKQNHSDAQLNLGLIYAKGNLVQRDIEKAIYYFSLAAKQNNSKALTNLGFIYEKGRFVPRDIKKAILCYSLAAILHNTIAQFNLAIIYLKGQYIPIDINKAIHYFTLAANQNDSNTQFILGIYYYEGLYVKQNIYKGIDLIMQSSKNNFIIAHFSLGFLYHEGKYIKKDTPKCIHLYKEASSFDSQFAKNNLGILYKYGFGDQIQKSLSISKIYFEEAIKQKNDMLAKYNLAHVYIYNESTSESINKSIKLLVESSKSGFQPSKELLCLVLFKKYGNNLDSI